MLNGKDSNSAGTGYSKNIQKPDKAITATGEVHTNEKATLYVEDLDLFVTVHLLEDTPPVLSLGPANIMDTPMCGAEVIKPHHMKIHCNTKNYVPMVVPGLSSGASGSSATPPPTTSLSQDTNREMSTQRPRERRSKQDRR